jgi:hypothetical protein
MLVTAIREVQIPLLSALLLGGCAAKAVRVLRTGSAQAGLGPTALFPMRMRRPLAIGLCAAELSAGAGLIATAGRLGRGELANVVRLGTALLFLVATCALIELRSARPDLGCGCFGDLSKTPVGGRALARSALLAAAALATVGLPPLRPPRPGADAITPLAVLLAELVLIAALSPEIGESLVRLGYSEPCELRHVPVERTLAALRRSYAWRKYAGVITRPQPSDVWRELCWRYVVFPARVSGRDADAVFAVYLKQRRPIIMTALVDSMTGEALPLPVTAGKRTDQAPAAAVGLRESLR